MTFYFRGYITCFQSKFGNFVLRRKLSGYGVNVVLDEVSILPVQSLKSSYTRRDFVTFKRPARGTFVCENVIDEDMRTEPIGELYNALLLE